MRRLRGLAVVWLLGLLVGILAADSTLAAFSDGTTNSGNTFTAAADFGGVAVTPIRDLGAASCGNTSNSLSVPAGGVAAGRTLIARLAHRTTVNGAVTVFDTQQNTWTRDADVFQGSVRLVVFSAYITKPLAQNDQITVTFPGVGDAVGFTVEEFAGIASTNRVDAVTTASGDSATPAATVTTTNGNDLLFGGVASFNNRAYTEASGWTTGKHVVIDCGGATRKADSHGASRVVSLSGTYTYNPTLSVAERWAAAVVAYRAASGSPSCVVATPTHVTGFEYGPTVTPSTGLISGASTAGGPVVVEGGVSRYGAYSLEVAKTNVGASYVDRSLAPAPTGVFSLALRLESLPTADVSSFFKIDAVAGSDLDVGYNATQQRFRIAFGSDAPILGTTTVVAGRWHHIDLRVALGANPRTADWRIDGVDQPQASHAATASSVGGIRYGSDVVADAFTVNYDDVLVSSTVADYPLGSVRILGLRPNGETTTNTTRTNFGNETGTLIGTTPYLRLDDDPMNSVTDYIWQDTASSTAHVELSFPDVATTCIKGVSGVVAYNSAGGPGANNGKTSIFSGSTERVVFSGDMTTGSSLAYARTLIAPPTAAWTQAALNGLVARFGYSTDISPAPHWHAVMLEYATLP